MSFHLWVSYEWCSMRSLQHRPLDYGMPMFMEFNESQDSTGCESVVGDLVSEIPSGSFHQCFLSNSFHIAPLFHVFWICSNNFHLFCHTSCLFKGEDCWFLQGQPGSDLFLGDMVWFNHQLWQNEGQWIAISLHCIYTIFNYSCSRNIYSIYHSFRNH